MESGVTLADLRKEENLETNTRSLSCCYVVGEVRRASDEKKELARRAKGEGSELGDGRWDSELRRHIIAS
eukprot:scaffold863_cov215-Skeletonema_menzelii.AAC.2